MVFLNGLSGTYLSATVPDISFSLVGYRALVEITAGADTLFSEYLFPIGGQVEFTALSDLLQPYVKQRLIADITVTVTEEFEGSATVDKQTMTATVVYCAADFGISSAASFLEEHFLSILMGDKVTAPGRLEYLHYIGDGTAAATAEYSDGSTAVFTLSAVAGTDRFKTVDASPSQFTATNKKLVAYTVTAGLRAQRFTIDFDTPDCAPVLLFSNSFGCDELVYCTGTHTVSPEFSRESAYFNRIRRNYHIEENREFKADTGILNMPMANWLDDLFRSERVSIVNFYDGVPVVGKDVVITDSKSEYTNDPGSLPRFTFTYTYAQRNHNVIDLRRGGRIFDNTFDNTFE